MSVVTSKRIDMKDNSMCNRESFFLSLHHMINSLELGLNVELNNDFLALF